MLIRDVRGDFDLECRFEGKCLIVTDCTDGGLAVNYSKIIIGGGYFRSYVCRIDPAEVGKGDIQIGRFAEVGDAVVVESRVVHLNRFVNQVGSVGDIDVQIKIEGQAIILGDDQTNRIDGLHRFRQVDGDRSQGSGICCAEQLPVLRNRAQRIR